MKKTYRNISEKSSNGIWLALLLASSIFIASCSGLSGEENEVVTNFLCTEWYDLQYEYFDELGADEDVYNYVELKFTRNGEELTYNWSRKMEASFTNNTLSGEGKVELSWDDKGRERIKIVLLDAEQEVFREGYIEIKKDSLIHKLTRQIELRKKRENVLSQAKIEIKSHAQGLFRSKAHRSGNMTEDHEFSEALKPVVLNGFPTSFGTKGKEIWWDLTEKYTGKTARELSTESLYNGFAIGEIRTILDAFRQDNIVVDSNIGDTYLAKVDGQVGGILLTPDLSTGWIQYICNPFEGRLCAAFEQMKMTGLEWASDNDDYDGTRTEFPVEIKSAFIVGSKETRFVIEKLHSDPWGNPVCENSGGKGCYGLGISLNQDRYIKIHRDKKDPSRFHLLEGSKYWSIRLTKPSDL